MVHPFLSDLGNIFFAIFPIFCDFSTMWKSHVLTESIEMVQYLAQFFHAFIKWVFYQSTIIHKVLADSVSNQIMHLLAHIWTQMGLLWEWHAFMGEMTMFFEVECNVWLWVWMDCDFIESQRYECTCTLTIKAAWCRCCPVVLVQWVKPCWPLQSPDIGAISWVWRQVKCSQLAMLYAFVIYFVVELFQQEACVLMCFLGQQWWSNTSNVL